MEIEVLKPTKVKANYLLVLAYPRYWEDSKLNGVYDDENLPKMPCITNSKTNEWKLLIHIETGQIINWVKGNEAKIHYKTCDNCHSYLLKDQNEIDYLGSLKWSIPSPLIGNCDYLIFDIDKEGFIQNWKPEKLKTDRWELINN